MRLPGAGIAPEWTIWRLGVRSLTPRQSGRWSSASGIPSSRRTSPFSTMRRSVRSTRWRNIGAGASKNCPPGSAMPAFDYRQAQEVRDAFARHGCRYLFIGKSGAILLGFPDTTQDADLFIEKSPENGRALVRALCELGFQFTGQQAEDIERGKDFVQLKNGPFDLDLVFAPGGIERFADA